MSTSDQRESNKDGIATRAIGAAGEAGEAGGLRDGAVRDGAAQDGEGLAVADLLAGRADSYRMFSRLFFKPLEESEIERFAATDYVSVAKTLEGSGLLAEGFNDMGRALRRRHTGTRQQLATDFTMCFDGVETVSEQVAVPYASVFLSEEALLNQAPRHEVYRVYRSESIRLRSGVNLPEDHLSFELEFLAILSERIAQAFERDDRAEAIRNLELSREFINGHILSWLDLLRERAERILKTRFYRGALKATKGYLELDLETIEGLIEVTAGGAVDGEVAADDGVAAGG